MGNLQRPENFNMRDLFLDISLETCINGSSRDFTGRKTFSTSFYRKNIGFGITDINIEINTSLQPTIDITFKDLYGNTLFGTQRTDDSQIDSSVLFNWPPPKFIFSFKGFLGRKVTWLLNLKTTNVTYVPTDGSFEIKCTFVPNQWGFLSDLPVLYLLACKKLRYEAYKNSNYIKHGDCIFTTDSVFSYVRTGKRVETKTTETTKDFDLLLKQLGSIKYGIGSAVCGAKIIKPNEEIIGVVNNIEIKGFTNLKIVLPNDITEDQLIEYSKDTNNVRKIDAYLQFNIQVAENANPESSSYSYIQSSRNSLVNYQDVTDNGFIQNEDEDVVRAYKSQLFKIIDANIKAIDDEIKRRVYSSTKSQIQKLTIGEVFRQVARDSGFILGSILQAGLVGYAKNKASRDSDNGRKELIGKCFPLFLNADGEEIPAMKPSDVDRYGEGPSTDYGVAEYEMAFVDKFIEAIGEGIADNLIGDDISGSGTDAVKNRINNLEAIRPNPYRPFYSNIAENILIRSGIIAYITRSSDPAKPGDYPNDLKNDRDDSESIITLAEMDMENLTKDIIGQMSFDDKQSLKRFCTFFDRFISGNRTDTPVGLLYRTGYFMEYSSDSGNILGSIQIDAKTNAIPFSAPDITSLMPFGLPINTPVNNFILDAKVNVGERITTNNIIDLYQSGNLSKEKADRMLEETFLTLRQLISEIIPLSKSKITGSTQQSTSEELDSELFPSYPTSDIPAFYNASLIDPTTLTSSLVVNNGLYWSIPKPNKDKYVFVLFDNPNDVDKTKEIYAQDATSEESIEGKGIFTSADSDPVGFIPISQVKSVYDENEVSHRITSLNDRIQDGNCINYSKCKTLYFNTDEYLQNSKIQSSENKLPSEIAAQNLSYSVYTHITSSGDATLESTPIVFGPFLAPTTIDDRRSLNQRIAIKTMCKSILQKMDEIDTERSQIIASVFGKAGEQRESLYKQMHTIFHQWEVMASSISNREYCSGYELKEDESLALEMEKEFGLCDSHQERGDGSSSLRELGGEKSTLFVYDYPLAPVNKKNINVKNSIINIEPLYKPNGSTTCLNVIQQICTKNNFVFVPFPGDANSDNINDIFKPYPQNPNSEKLMNYFHVIFTPTPESRIRLSNDDNEFLTDTMDSNSFQNNAISIEFGAIDNQIIKSFNVGTDSTKPTAESILNLQRIVDKENSDHQVKMDCSMLPVYEGRSYKATIEMLGNAQVYPMQYFYIQKAPMFGGLYQILKVSHSITPNDMTTRAEGIRMRFNQGQYGGIEPVTLDDLESLGNVSSPMEVNIETTLGSEEGYDAPAYNLSGPYNIEENELAEQLDSGLINISQYIEKKFIPYVTSSKNMSFLSSSPEHEKKMKSVGWSPGLSWCSFFVKNIYSDILKGEQRIEALKFVSGNVYQTQQNAQKGLKYFALTKKPSVGSYVIWRNVSQSTPGVIKGHAGLVLSVNGDKIRVIEGNYAAGCRGEIGVNVQSSKCGSTSVIREYDATIDSLRDGGALYLVAYITPKKIMSAEEIASQFKKFQTITDDEKSNAILDFNNLLSESEKMYVLSKFSDLEKQAIEILLKSSSFDLSRVSDTEKSKFLSYLDG